MSSCPHGASLLCDGWWRQGPKSLTPLEPRLSGMGGDARDMWAKAVNKPDRDAYAMAFASWPSFAVWRYRWLMP